MALFIYRGLMLREGEGLCHATVLIYWMKTEEDEL